MPTVKLLPPDSNVTSNPPSSSHRYYPGLYNSHIYLTLGTVVVVFVVISRFAARRKLGGSQRSTTPSLARSEKAQLEPQHGQAYYRKDSPASYTTKQVFPLWESAPESLDTKEQIPEGLRGLETGFGAGEALSGQFIWATGLLGPAVPAGDWGSGGPLTAAQAMGGRGHQQRDAASGPEHPASRGVSISPGAADRHLRRQQNPSSAGVEAGAHSQRRGKSPTTSGFSFADSSSRRQSSGSDGAADSHRSKGKGKGKGKSRAYLDSETGRDFGDEDAEDDGMAPPHDVAESSVMPQGMGFVAVDYIGSRHLPPPPPPLTPPTLSASSFLFQDRRPGYAVSIPPQLDTTFIHQPNPDYMGSSTSADVMSSSPKSATSSPGTRRRSYNKSVPIGIPNTSSASSQDSSLTLTSADTFSPASYPPTSPLLPPPPPGHEFGYDTLEYAYDDPNAPPVVGAQGQIDLQGEIISVMDQSGHGWKRHTRVYGGGVCLACVASGGEHGGFYGDKVPPEQRR